MTKRHTAVLLLITMLLASGSLLAQGDARPWSGIRKWTGKIGFSVRHDEKKVDSSEYFETTNSLRVSRSLDATFTLEIDPDKLNVEENDIVLWDSKQCDVSASVNEEANSISKNRQTGEQTKVRYASQGSGKAHEPCEIHLAIEAGPDRKARFTFGVPGAEIDGQLTADITGAPLQTIPQSFTLMLQSMDPANNCCEGKPPVVGEPLTGSLRVPVGAMVGVLTAADPVYADVTWNFQPVGGPQALSVSLQGCTDLIEGETTTAQATGKPGGGSYRWWADPADPITISPLAANATLTGATPGKATIHVEYTGAGGKKAQASKQGASVRVVSINAGAAIPKLGLYDAKGQPRSPTRSVPLELVPSGDLSVDFPPADSSVASVVAHGTTIELQGAKCGTTTIQGQSHCGQKGGPVATIQVVACDDDVIADLRKQMDDQRKLIEMNMKQMAEVLQDPAFKRAEGVQSDTAQAIADLTKALTDAGGGAGVKAVGSAISNAKTMMKALKGDFDGAAFSVLSKQVKDAYKNTAAGEVLGAASIMKDLYSFSQSSSQVAADLGSIEGTWERVQEIEARLTEYGQKFDVVDKRLNGTCKKCSQGSGGQGQPPAGASGQAGQGGQPPQPGQGTQAAGQSQTPAGQGTEPATSGQDAGAAPTPGGEGGPPVHPPRDGGAGQGGGQSGIPLDLNQPCKAETIQGFTDKTAGGYHDTLTQYQSALKDIERAMGLDDQAMRQLVESAMPEVGAFISGTEDFSAASLRFVSDTKDCGQQAQGVVTSLNKQGEKASKMGALVSK